MSPASRMPRLLDAVVAISSDLELPHVLERIVEAAVGLVDATYGALGVIGPGANGLDLGLVEFITVGADAALIERIGHYPEGRGILGLLVSDPRPRRLSDLGSDPHSSGFPAGHPPMTSFLGVPVRIRGAVYGNLYLTDKRGAPEFSAADEDLVVALAGAAGVAIENARLHARVQELAVLGDRERIARDLHDTVIQRLFATGMGLQSIIRRARDPKVSARIQQAVGELDDTIREIRGAIFALQAHERGDRSLRVRVLAAARGAGEALGFDPRVHFDGPVDSVASSELEEHMLITLGEAITNIARHAEAGEVDIYVSATDTLTLRVVDNGRGLPDAMPHRSGLRNLESRAQELGGAFKIAPRERSAGTVLTWEIPLAAD